MHPPESNSNWHPDEKLFKEVVRKATIQALEEAISICESVAEHHDEDFANPARICANGIRALKRNYNE